MWASEERCPPIFTRAKRRFVLTGVPICLEPRKLKTQPSWSFYIIYSVDEQAVPWSLHGRQLTQEK